MTSGPWMSLHRLLCAFRHLFETTARQLLSDNPRVQFVYGATVSGLLFEGDSCEQGATVVAAAAAGAGCGSKQGLAVTGKGQSHARRLALSAVGMLSHPTLIARRQKWRCQANNSQVVLPLNTGDMSQLVCHAHVFCRRCALVRRALSVGPAGC